MTIPSIESKYYEANCKNICKKYKGKWIAISGKKVIGNDENVVTLYEKIQPFKKTPLFIFITENEVNFVEW